MREVISVHVGQAGVQIGNACCESPLILCRALHPSDRVNLMTQKGNYIPSSMV